MEEPALSFVLLDVSERVCPVVLRQHAQGCPSCGSVALLGEDFCQPCGVFRCPRCLVWRLLHDGGGDDPRCNDCWSELRDKRVLAARRLWEDLRPNRWRREAAAALREVLSRGD